MRFGSLCLSTALASAMLLVAGCGGDGGTDPDPTPVATTVTITSGPINLTEIGATTAISATVRDQNGQELPGASLSFASDNTSVATVSGTGVVTATGDGSAGITVSSGSASADVTATVTVSTLQAGLPVPNISGDSASVRIFTVEVESGAVAGRLFEIGTSGGAGDADVFVRFGAPPVGSTFDCASVSSANGEVCTFADAQAGTWYVGIQGFTDYAGLDLVARFVDPTPVTLGSPLSDLSGLQDEVLYFDFDVPAAAAPEAAARPGHPGALVMGVKPVDGVSMGEMDRKPAAPEASGGPLAAEAPTLNIVMSGGTGDADLIATATQPVSRTPFDDVECWPFLDGNEESCSIASPAPGRWVAAISGFAPFSGVTLSVSYAPADGGGPTPGTITIQKEIQSSSGGPPDNPADPSLSGFVFEIRPAGGGAVAATVTTNASGVAQASLAAGSYDVTESSAQGLTDVTGAANGLTVPEGGNVDVAWINRQPAPSGGNNVPTAVIEVGPTGVPSGDNHQTEVRLYGGNSTDADGDALTYAWSAPGGSFIGSTDLAFARVTFPGGSAQTISLTVSDGEVENTAQVQIAGTGPLPAAGTFDIELVPIEPITDPDAQAAFDLAESTWESIIRNELPNVTLNRTAAENEFCFDGAPAINETIDDVRIYVEFAPGDGPGGTLASAGPCLIRSSSNPSVQPVTTIFGIMKFDSDDFGNLSATALNRVILHEMAHVLGFGTLWTRNELLENPSCPDTNSDGAGDCDAGDPPGPDARFTGPAASAAYRALGGIAEANVPVENAQGGAGTRDGHWRESIFERELMTGFLTNNVTNPLSLITVGALDDSGFTVDYSQVDNYSIPGSTPFPAPGDPGVLDLRDDIRTGPIWGVTETGEIVLVRAGR